MNHRGITNGIFQGFISLHLGEDVQYLVSPSYFIKRKKCQLYFLLFIRKPELLQNLLLPCFDLGAKERGHGLHASLVHLCQTFLSSGHLFGRLE